MDYLRPQSWDHQMIPFANPLAQYQSCRKEILEAIKRVLESGNYILGPEVEKFEKSFAGYCGTDYAVGVNSGTDALILTLRAMDIGLGDEVITVSHTALATVAAIIASGATPVLVDIDPKYYTLDPEGFRRAVTPRSRAVIPVHLYGQPADMASIMEIAKEYGLFVIEDCAQATGATYRGSRVGSIGDVGCFSFFPTKNLGAMGDGGMAVMRDAKLEERIRRLRQYGWDRNRTTMEPGLNSRLDEIQAAFLNVKLKNLDENNARRRAIARMYTQALAGLPLNLPAERPEGSHVYHLYVIGCDDRNMLRNKLAENEILAGVHYPVAGHQHYGYEQRRISPEAGLPVTEGLVDRILSLPLYPEISSSQVEKIVSLMARTFNSA